MRKAAFKEDAILSDCFEHAKDLPRAYFGNATAARLFLQAIGEISERECEVCCGRMLISFAHTCIANYFRVLDHQLAASLLSV
jgi:hypothetical protein